MRHGTAADGMVGWRSRARCTFVVLAWLFLCADPASAQSPGTDPDASVEAPSLGERMQRQRAAARARELVTDLGLVTVPRRAVEVPNPPSEATERVFWWLSPSRTPIVELEPLVAYEAPEPEPPPPPRVLADIVWDRVGAREQEAFLDRFAEVLWTNDGMAAFTPIDTMRTEEVRARLFGAFGAPTRTAVARGVRGFEGSVDVQFEYWFVVNDSIPFVVLDVDGPFARGLVLAGAYAHRDVLRQLKRDLTRRLGRARRMAFVDYYFSRDRDTWYRTGFDGADFFTEEIDRPRWARRRSERGRWYLFR